MSKPSKRRRAHRQKVLALFNATTLALLLTGSAFASSLQQVHTFDMEAQPLADALIHFGQQAGIQVSVDSQLLRGKSVLPLHGEYSGSEALQHLLSGSGLYWQEDESGLLTLKEANGAPLALDNIQVSDHRSPLGETVIGRNLIESLPAGNGDITSLLKIHPNVQFDDNQLSSKTPGEIGPANISINGAKFYQNAFLLDGMNMNNDINPGDTVNANDVNKVPGRSQGLALDTDLLEEVKVLDSNVSAAYGGFNGGVVEANTRKPTKDLHGKLSYQTTRSSWTRYHVDEDQQEWFDSASMSDLYNYQPDFRKHTVRATLEGHVTEDFGLLASFVQKTSTIPLSVYSPNNLGKTGYESSTQDRELKSQNFFIKGVWKANERLDLEGSLTYAPESATYYRDNALNTRYTIDAGGLLFNFKSIYQGEHARYTQQLGLSQFENSRDSDADDWHNWRKNAVKNWGLSSALEGGYGDVEQTQKSLDYKLNVDWDALELLGATHHLSSGLEFRHQKFDYERLTNSDVNVYLALPATGNCTPGAATAKHNSTYEP